MDGIVNILLLVMIVAGTFMLGYTKGRLYEIERNKPQEETETPWKRHKIKIPKVNFADQLDPIVPEGTKRSPINNPREVNYDRDE
jgi:hypothetical protein